MEQLISYIRPLIEDDSTPYDFTDDQIKMYINKFRKSVYNLTVTYEFNDYKTYVIGYKYLSAFRLRDSVSNVVDSDEYSIDEINGIVKFTDTQDGSYLADFQYHDLDNSIAEIWKARAGKARGMGTYKLGDQELPQGKESVEYCISKYWSFMKSRSFGMSR